MLTEERGDYQKVKYALPESQVRSGLTISKPAYPFDVKDTLSRELRLKNGDCMGFRPVTGSVGLIRKEKGQKSGGPGGVRKLIKHQLSMNYRSDF
ncbi:hypothetical protein SCT_0092 [Sulfuricella sp. T08]|nr:hypothetical protein SCT_0092 [Sulfuricella sp. T08]